MNEDDKTLSEQSKRIHDECPSTNPKIAESADAVEKARQAIIKLRIRRRKRTVIIK